MRTLYIDCSMGAAGDMLTAALLELMPDREEAIRELNALNIPGVTFEAETSVKCGITGTHVSVKVHGEEEDEHMHDHHHEHHHEHEHEHEHEHHHHHSSLHDIEHIVRGHLGLCNNVTDDIMAVFGLVADAESTVHGKPIEQIHFHEVGTMDAVADITAVCWLLDKLKVDRVVASPVHVGSGTVKCAHGILPVPAPATAHILKGVPTYGGAIQSELCTPTGAAILKHFVSSFGPQPMMCVDKIGYGMGKKDFEAANCVRVSVGETPEAADTITEIDFNVDDMTGEELGFALERFYEAGALDVFMTGVMMKKSRPGILVRILCKEEKKSSVIESIFKHTTTIGLRECVKQRAVLERSIETIDTKFGPVRVKRSSGYGKTVCKYEYDDLAKIAIQNNMSLNEVKEEIENAHG